MVGLMEDKLSAAGIGVMTGPSQHRFDRSQRPDILDLISERFDSNAELPAEKTLIICSAPRTGSYELCRLLYAAGVAIAHEYFHAKYSKILASRWGLSGDPLAQNELGGYMDVLRRRRAVSGVFGTKIQFQQFQNYLRNRHGEALFECAVVVHLFRPDAAAQFLSWQRSVMSGIWDYSGRQSTEPSPTDSKQDAVHTFNRVMELTEQDAGFRQIFAVLGIRPLFLTTDELFAAPRRAIERIAQALDVPVNDPGLDAAIAVSAPYDHPGQGAQVTGDLASLLKPMLFQK